MTVHTLGGEFSNGKSRAAWLVPLLPIAIAAFAIGALVSYHLRADVRGDSPLQGLVIGIYQFVGFVPSFLFFLLVLSWGSIWWATGKLERPGVLLLRLLGLTLALAIWVNLRADTGEVLPHSGALGAWIGGRMVSVLGTVLSTLLVAPLTLVTLLLATDYFFISYFEGLGVSRVDRPAGRRATADSGVETDVTEHFKGLSRVFAPRPAAAARPSAPPPIVDLGDLEAAIQDSGIEAPPSPGDGEAPPTGSETAGEASRRLSHFERRQLAARARGGDTAASTTEPEAEIESPPTVVPRPEPAPSAARDDDEFSIAAASLDEDDEDDEGEPTAIDEADESPRGWLAPLSPDAPEGTAPALPRAPAGVPAGASGEESDELVEELEESEDADESDVPADSELQPGVYAEADDTRAGESADATAAAADADEQIVAIPRPADGARQQRLFVSGLDEAVVREAIEVVESARRVSVGMLQRKLRIDGDQATELLALLAHRGMIELSEDGTHGRART